MRPIGIDRMLGAIETMLGILPPSGLIRVLAVPTEEDTLTISDGVTATVYTFWDDGNESGDPNEIIIGEDADETLANIVTAINVNAPGAGERGIIAEDDGTLWNTVTGILGNVAILCDADPDTEIAILGMWSRPELNVDLPDTDDLTIHLGRTCHRIKLEVDSGASCVYTFDGTASADLGQPLTDKAIIVETIPHGAKTVSVFCADDQSLKQIHIVGY